MASSSNLGIDLSSDPKRTAACLLNWDRKRLRIAELAPEKRGEPLELERLASLIRHSERTGIDSPFGWPEEFVRAVSRWEEKGEWNWADRTPLRYRATDEKVRGRPRMPLSVSTDRLGATTMTCALLLSRLRGVNRAGTSGPVAEVYPAAALHEWGLRSTNYKGESNEALDVRRAILAGLKRGLGSAWRPSKSQRSRLEKEHDMLDAFVAALVARAVQLERASKPETAEEKRLADFEGWIRVPQCSLAELVDA